MKKRVLSLFMTLMLCMTSLPTTALAATDSEVGSYASATAETDQSQVDVYAHDTESTTEECEHDDATYIQVWASAPRAWAAGPQPWRSTLR